MLENNKRKYIKMLQTELFKIFICMGIGCIASSMIYFKLTINEWNNQIEYLTKTYIRETRLISLFFLFGYMLIFYGIVFYISKNKKLRNNRIQITFTTLFFMYALMVTLLLTINSYNDVLIVLSLMFWITGFLYLIFNLIVYGKNILISTIADPKDRITIVLAVGGAIISLIALFK